MEEQQQQNKGKSEPEHSSDNEKNTRENKEVESRVYRFNDERRIVDQNGKNFVFTTQDDYERLGEYVTEKIYEFLIKPPYNLRKILLSGDDVTDKPADELPKDESFIFASRNLNEAKTLAIIIHGTGVVRAGQWSRRLIINNSLESGSQLPYIQRCLDRGFGVLVTNTNDNHFVDENGEKVGKRESSTAERHGLTVWDRFVRVNESVKNIVIIAHSYGGVVTSKIIETEVPHLQKIKCICLTDALFDDSILKSLRIPARNWVRSTLALDEKVSPNDQFRVSSGTEEHERTSAFAIESVFTFIDKSLR